MHTLIRFINIAYCVRQGSIRGKKYNEKELNMNQRREHVREIKKRTNARVKEQNEIFLTDIYYLLLFLQLHRFQDDVTRIAFRIAQDRFNLAVERR